MQDIHFTFQTQDSNLGKRNTFAVLLSSLPPPLLPLTHGQFEDPSMSNPMISFLYVCLQHFIRSYFSMYLFKIFYPSYFTFSRQNQVRSSHEFFPSSASSYLLFDAKILRRVSK